jgi:four helix bundle protein
LRDFRELKVWEKSHHLALSVYKATAGFPKEETYGLLSQIRRASVSIPANIAEGCGKIGDNEFTRYLVIAMGSASELEYELLLAHDPNYLEDEDYGKLTNELIEVRKMLNALIQKIKSSK